MANEWIQGQPVQTDNDHYEWIMGQPYVLIDETEEAAVGNAGIMTTNSGFWGTTF